MLWESFILIAVWLCVGLFVLKLILGLFGWSLGLFVVMGQWVWKNKVKILILIGATILTMAIFGLLR